MNRQLFLDTILQNERTDPPRYAVQDTGPSLGTPDEDSAPPPYHLEQLRLPIGGIIPDGPLVSVSQLKVHLGLLRTPSELQDRVTDPEIDQDTREKFPSLAPELEHGRGGHGPWSLL
jgi:hypothetical protein